MDEVYGRLEQEIERLEQENAKLKTERDEYQEASAMTMQDFADLLGVETHHCTSWGDLYSRAFKLKAERDELLENLEHCKGNELATEVEKFKAELAKVKQRETQFRDALVHISEYWNGNDSYTAMVDACERMTTVARKTLGKS